MSSEALAKDEKTEKGLFVVLVVPDQKEVVDTKKFPLTKESSKPKPKESELIIRKKKDK